MQANNVQLNAGKMMYGAAILHFLSLDVPVILFSAVQQDNSEPQAKHSAHPVLSYNFGSLTTSISKTLHIDTVEHSYRYLLATRLSANIFPSILISTFMCFYIDTFNQTGFNNITISCVFTSSPSNQPDSHLDIVCPAQKSNWQCETIYSVNASVSVCRQISISRKILLGCLHTHDSHWSGLKFWNGMELSVKNVTAKVVICTRACLQG